MLIDQDWKILRFCFFFLFTVRCLVLKYCDNAEISILTEAGSSEHATYCSTEVTEAKPNFVFVILFLHCHFLPGPSVEQFILFRKHSLFKSPLKQNKLPRRVKGIYNLVMIGCNECCGCLQLQWVHLVFQLHGTFPDNILYT